MFARILDQIMPDERSSGFDRNLLSWGTNSSTVSSIREHVDVCAIHHSLKDSSARLSHHQETWVKAYFQISSK